MTHTRVNSASGAWLAAASVGTGTALGLLYNGVIHRPERWVPTPPPAPPDR